MTQLTENTLFAERYLFQRLLGRGGFSEVWLAIDKMTGLEIAVKVYAPGQGMDTDGMNDFCKELSQVYNLNHTNLIKPQHVDNWEGMPYLVMTYCPKGSCHRLVGAMTEEQIWKVIHDVASGLAYLHNQEIIHQDIKPDNILMDPLGNYVITDFGISVQSRSTLRRSMNIATGSGTTAYMGPERFSKDPTPIKASDIWSLGATVYELLTGNAPFGEIGGGLQKGGADVPTIKQDISPALRQTIALMLEENPWDRPTASLLADWAENPAMVEFALKNLKKSGSVSSDSSLKISPQSFDVEPAGGEQYINVQTSEEWNCYINAEYKWLQVKKISEKALKITYKANESGKERSATINVLAGARAATISLTQKPLPKRSQKALYISFAVIGALILTIGIAIWNHGEKEKIRIKKLREIYTEETTRCEKFIESIKYDDELMKIQAPIDGISKIKHKETIKHFPKTKLKAQSQKLQSAYLDSLKSFQSQLEKEIKYEKSLLPAGKESTWLKTANKNKQSIDHIISLFDSGYSINEINDKLKTSQK